MGINKWFFQLIKILWIFTKLRKKRKSKHFLEITNKQKGDDCEFQIGESYKRKGYKIHHNGINKGVADNGIDLVAYKGDEAVLIQCKNWERTQVKQEQLRIFLGDCTSYIEKNQRVFANKTIRRVFVTSCENIDYGVKKFVEENEMEYLVIAYKKQWFIKSHKSMIIKNPLV